MDTSDITCYFYTAWNGYAWQGCDEKTASDLQRYLEETGTMPESPDAALPFGGAIGCRIAGRMGTALYRYHVRRQGDAFGRDSLYVVLAFIPCGAPPIDFVDLLKSTVMSVPREGELAPETIPCAAFLASSTLRPSVWQEASLSREVRGIEALAESLRLFQDRGFQLGLLKMSIKSDALLHAPTAALEYRVFPEVRVLAGESEPGERRAALEELESRARKIPGYLGLNDYVREKRKVIDGTHEREHRLADYCQRLAIEIERVRAVEAACRHWPKALDFSRLKQDVLSDLERAQKVVDEFASVLPVEGARYHDAVLQVLELARRVAAGREALFSGLTDWCRKNRPEKEPSATKASATVRVRPAPTERIWPDILLVCVTLFLLVGSLWWWFSRAPDTDRRHRSDEQAAEVEPAESEKAPVETNVTQQVQQQKAEQPKKDEPPKDEQPKNEQTETESAEQPKESAK